jgi:site-specific DNA recombinase
VDQVLDTFAPRRLPTCTLGGVLGRKPLRNAIGALTPVRPLALMRDGVHVPLAHGETPFRLLSYVQYMLVNPYYMGIVRYRGVEYQGRHDPLVSKATWQRVQDVLAEKSETRQKLRKHPHYLKGIYCGDCGSSMIVTKARSRAGRIYPYFVCIGRHQKRNNCTKRAVLIDRVEELVEQHYAAIRLPDELLDIVDRNLRSDIAAYYEAARSDHVRFDKQRSRLFAEQDKLLEAHYADAIPLDLLKREQERIAKQLALIEERIEASADHQAVVEANLESAMKLARDCQSAYLTAPPKIRRLFNQAFFAKLYVDDDTIRSELAPPFNVLLARGSELEQTDWTAFEGSYNDSDLEAKYLEVAGLKEHQLVGAPGIELGEGRSR